MHPRTLVRVSVSVLAALVLVVPAVAKPKAASTKVNHGKAVRVAAQCPVQGKAHGQLVRTIAKNKAATVEDAQAACDAALALQNPAPTTPPTTPPPTP